jgi:hypothetical protein
MLSIITNQLHTVGFVMIDMTGATDKTMTVISNSFCLLFPDFYIHKFVEDGKKYIVIDKAEEMLDIDISVTKPIAFKF